MFKVSNLSFSYQNSKKKALKNINLEIRKGEVVLLCGPNGGGKSTFLKALMGIIPNLIDGNIEGSVLYNKKQIKNFNIPNLAGKIGILLQDADFQLTSLTPYEEVSFGLCNLRLPLSVIDKKTKDTINLMGLAGLEEQPITTLSGGQKQRLSIAGLLAMEPQAIILDEPASSLDPKGIQLLVETLDLIKKEVPLIIISTHWIDPFLNIANRIILINGGKISSDFPSVDVCKHEKEILDSGIQIPQICEISKIINIPESQIRDPGFSLSKINFNRVMSTFKKKKLPFSPGKKIELEKVNFSYDKQKPVLRNISSNFRYGARITLVGENGSGKTTLARIVAGLKNPTTGKVRRDMTNIAMVLQNPTLGFIENTVFDELKFNVNADNNFLDKFLTKFDLIKYKNVSPFMLSEGEKKKLAIAAAIIRRPDLLILDEPTVGLDLISMNIIMKELENFPGTILFITHDPRIVGEHTEQLLILDNGLLVYYGSPFGMNTKMLTVLAYKNISLTAKLALSNLKTGIPLVPSQIKLKR